MKELWVLLMVAFIFGMLVGGFIIPSIWTWWKYRDIRRFHKNGWVAAFIEMPDKEGGEE